MTNKIESIKMAGTEYNTLAMTPDTLAQFIKDVNSTKDTEAVCKHYKMVKK